MEVLPYVGSNSDKEKYPLDAKDKKLLHLLGNNARAPLTKISKQVQLSRDAVNYRIKSYFKKGVLKGSRAIIDVKKFGYDAYHLFVNLKSPSEKVEEEIIRKISSLEYVRAVLKFYGHYELEIAVIARNNEELEEIVDEITEIISGEGKEMELLILTKNLRSGPFPTSFLKEKSFSKSIPFKKYIPDKTDMALLKELSNNATISLVDLASKIRLSPDAASYRIKNLMASGHLLAFSYVINYSAIGYEVYAILLNIRLMDKSDEEKLREFFLSDENVFWATKTIGKYNILSYLAVKNIEELHNSIRKIKLLFPDKLSSHEYLSAVAEYKYAYAPDCLFK